MMYSQRWRGRWPYLAMVLVVLLSAVSFSLVRVARQAKADGASPWGPNGGNWNLTFQDDFSQDSALDTTNTWTPYWGAPGQPWNPNKVSWSSEVMDPANVYVQDGLLTIHAHVGDDGSVTSGVVTTRGHFSQQHGFFEARMKVSNVYGVLSAWWMQYDPDHWPPEIDVAEILGKQPTTDYTTIHYNNPDTPAGHTNDNLADLSSDFHTYGVEWGPGVLNWYLDGQLLWTVANPGGDFDAHAMYLQLNMHVGNDWAGYPAPNSDAYMYVQYVRAWQYA